MSLTDKLLAVPQRENAGSRTANRFNYQQVWAFNHMLEMLEKGIEFILFMEFHDDIIIIDNSSNLQLIDFYQIKTDNKASRYITTSFITRNAKKYPEKMSIAQKMVENYSKFREDTKSIHLVSNKHFDFGELNTTEKSVERAIVKLNEISEVEFKKIKSGMCQSCDLFEKNCNEECVDLIYFDVSLLDLVNYEDTVLGKFINHLSNIGVESSISKTKTLFYTILGEIKRINNWEIKSQNVSELLRCKSISKEDFVFWINKLRVEMPDDLWNEIREYLLNDGFSSFEVHNIGKQWKKYSIDAMNVDNISIKNIREEIQKIKLEKEFGNSKEYLEYIYSKIKYRLDVKVHSKEYIYAIIVKELFL